MKPDPFALLGFVGVIGVAGIEAEKQGLPYLLGAVLCGGVLNLLYSLWVSRKRHSDAVDTSLWAMISTVGAMGLGFLLGPDWAYANVFGMKLPSAPTMAFIITTSGGPAIEAMLAGDAWRWVKEMWENRKN
jgi:hypothetical protein